MTIELSFSQELSLVMNTFYQFTLPTHIHPKYLHSLPQPDLLNTFRLQRKNSQAVFSWDFRVRVTTTRKLISYHSVEQQLAVESKNDGGTEYVLTLANG